jgi:hypothetical protein
VINAIKAATLAQAVAYVEYEVTKLLRREIYRLVFPCPLTNLATVWNFVVMPDKHQLMQACHKGSFTSLYLSCVIFWVVLLRMVFNSRRFGTLCLFHLHRRVDAKCVSVLTHFRNVDY